MLTPRDVRNWLLLATLSWLTFALFGAAAWSQHTPSVLTPSAELHPGVEIAIDADVLWHDPNLQGVEVVAGTVLMHDSIVASSDGSSPIVLRLPAGTHSIDALGFPADRMNPQRLHKVLSLAVVETGRQEQVTAALAEMFAARDRFLALTPTAQEVADALTSFILQQAEPSPAP